MCYNFTKKKLFFLDHVQCMGEWWVMCIPYIAGNRIAGNFWRVKYSWLSNI